MGSPLIGMSQDGLAAFEPAWADELSVIMDWAFDYMQRGGDADPDEETWLRDETGGAVYLRLSTPAAEQMRERADEAFALRCDRGGPYWSAAAGAEHFEVVIAYQARRWRPAGDS